MEQMRNTENNMQDNTQSNTNTEGRYNMSPDKMIDVLLGIIGKQEDEIIALEKRLGGVSIESAGCNTGCDCGCQDDFEGDDEYILQLEGALDSAVEAHDLQVEYQNNLVKAMKDMVNQIQSLKEEVKSQELQISQYSAAFDKMAQQNEALTQELAGLKKLERERELASVTLKEAGKEVGNGQGDCIFADLVELNFNEDRIAELEGQINRLNAIVHTLSNQLVGYQPIQPINSNPIWRIDYPISISRPYTTCCSTATLQDLAE